MNRGPIFLIGPMASGKTSVGKALAKLLGCEFIDTDKIVVQRHGTIAEIFARSGEAEFRRLETETLKEVASSYSVIATGGGSILSPENRALISHSGTPVYLEIDEAAVTPRLRGQGARPLLAGDDPVVRWVSIFAEREQIYQELAELVVDARRKPPRVLARDIAERLDLLPGTDLNTGADLDNAAPAGDDEQTN
ncbi:shikimate kinase [Neomicrococcus lactis]